MTSSIEVNIMIAQDEVKLCPDEVCLSTVDKPHKLYALLIIPVRQ
ncbi:hypothetical protein CSC18_0663 [Klebsiella aerogenes]|nr:hypothetical protein CSC18_0663 [Klebsiella aerogenes]